MASPRVLVRMEKRDWGFELAYFVAAVQHFGHYATRTQIGWLFGWVLWNINPCRLFNAKSSLYIHIKYIWFSFFGFYGISTIVGYLMPNLFYTYVLNIYDLIRLGFMAYQPIEEYLMPNSLYTYIQNIYDLIWLGFMVSQPIVGYLMPNPLYTYILNIYDLIWLGFMVSQPIVGYLMPNPLYTYILNLYDLIWLGFYDISTNCRISNAKSSLYIYTKYIWFDLVGFYGISTNCRIFNAKSSLYIYTW